MGDHLASFFPGATAKWDRVFIGRLFGINFFLHWSWFVIAAFVTYTLSVEIFPGLLGHFPQRPCPIMGASAALLFFVSILLHELGHSVISQRCGIPVPRITLFLIGGIAEISREPDDAKSELKIALGGPAVTVALVLFYGAGGMLCRSLDWRPAEIVLKWLCFVNIGLILFNLIPGYPLDGGRVLRALLWAKTGKLRWATFLASRIGIAFAYVLIVLGAYFMAVLHQLPGFGFIIIGLFLKSAAETGYNNALQREVLAGVKVRDIMTAKAEWIPAGLPVSLVVEEYFMANHHIAFPVCDEDGAFCGLLRLEFLKSTPREKWPWMTAGEVVSAQQADKLSIEVEASAARAMRLLLSPGSGRLAVTDGGRLAGIVTRHDILHFIKIHTALED